MSNKMVIEFLCHCLASDLLDSHVLENDKLIAPTMERSTRSSLDGNSVEVSILLLTSSRYAHYCLLITALLIKYSFFIFFYWTLKLVYL